MLEMATLGLYHPFVHNFWKMVKLFDTTTRQVCIEIEDGHTFYEDKPSWIIVT